MLGKGFFLILAAHCLLVAVQSDKPTTEEATEKCRVKHLLTKEEVERMNETKFWETQDDNIKCYIKCVYVQIKLMNDDGEFTLDDPSNKDLELKENFEACTNVTGTDSCDKAMSFTKCLHKTLTKE